MGGGEGKPMKVKTRYNCKYYKDLCCSAFNGKRCTLNSTKDMSSCKFSEVIK